MVAPLYLGIYQNIFSSQLTIMTFQVLKFYSALGHANCRGVPAYINLKLNKLGTFVSQEYFIFIPTTVVHIILQNLFLKNYWILSCILFDDIDTLQKYFSVCVV